MLPHELDEDRVLAAAAAILGTAPRTTADLARRLTDAGVIDAGVDIESFLDFDSRFVSLTGERWLFGPAAVKDMTFTTTVTGVDSLSLRPDLEHLGWILIEAEPLTSNGEPIAVDEGPDGADVLYGPDGWLSALEGRDVAVGLADDVVHVALAQPGPVPAALSAAAAAVYQAHAEVHELPATLPATVEGSTVSLRYLTTEHFSWELLAAHRDLALACSPLPRVDMLLASAGLARQGLAVVPADQDPALLLRWYLRNQLRGFEHLEGSQVDSAEMVIGAISHFAAGHPNVLGELANAQQAAALLLAITLCDPVVAEAAWSHHRREHLEPDAVAGFAQLLVERVEGPAAVGARWLGAKALDHLGQPLDAEGHLEAALREGGDRFPLAARMLAGFVADRGDALRAARLLADSDVEEDDPLLEELVPFAMHRPRGTTPRNAPCRCGSGRKYKHCHLGVDEQHTLADRAGWLYTKARRYLRDNRFNDIESGVAFTITATSGRGEELRRMIANSELSADLALCEGGVLEPFVAERRSLLPADEATLADIWFLVERSVFEVENIQEDSLELRDVRRGEHITVTNTKPDTRTRPGMYLLGRPLPVEDTYRAFGGFIPVPAVLLEDALAVTDRADLDEVAQLVGRCLAMPTILNTDGHHMVHRQLTYRVDPTAAVTAFDGCPTLRARHDGESRIWHLVRDTANQQDAIIAALNLGTDGDQLTISVNSTERAQEAQTLLNQLLLDAEFMADRAPPPSAPGELNASSAQFLEDPAVLEALEAFIRQHEQRWLDESIPALRGRTPRQAARDPIERLSLQRLLRTFPDTGDPGTMSPARLRAALDLPD